ncbi:tetratricopeptide repeat protein [Sedimentitalea sp. JM2-8]|uniref:Tetratricopeptide repeat protein n=1 Tax=Sedimentitalea xiamensis TaxID=3050037 RepID=A0ABT7FE48_9RHOB|nr:tetratricopeptide repeat protein [Sedimentitalea xiamensis]MDK3073263.1 tetratricopeptide repeat protein [Sedimentitalea xiamensis]
MAPAKATRKSIPRIACLAIAVCSAVAACGPAPITNLPDSPYAPGVDLRKDAVDGVEVGNRLMAASEYELALDAFTRAALEQGMTPEILTGLGTANLGLGRLGQSEKLLRRAVVAAPDWPEAWNNLGVVLMEMGEIAEATQIFRKAYALDNGESDSIRDNLRLALAKSENSAIKEPENEDYKLVRRGSSEFLIRKTP